MQTINLLKFLPPKVVLLTGALAFVSSGAWAAINCTSGPSVPNTTFTINNLLDIAAGDPQLRQSAVMTVSCRKQHIRIQGDICLRVGEGSAGTPVGTPYAPRWLKNASGDYIAFQIHKAPTYDNVWGTTVNGNTNSNGTQWYQYLYMFGSTAFAYSTINDLNNRPAFSMELPTSFPTVAGVNTLQMAAPGSYTSSYNDANTRLLISLSAGRHYDCIGGDDTAAFPYSFTVTANITPQCKIKGTVADIDFGTQSGTATNLQGSTALIVQCTRTTPYYIGLLPGNGNTAGAGVMYGQAPLTAADTVAYQLRSTAGMSGTIWGNTATSISVGNGVAGTGTGSDQNHTIYATMASANAPAGSYQDTVTVTVNY